MINLSISCGKSLNVDKCVHLCHQQHKSRYKVFLSPKKLSHVPLLAVSSQATTDMLSASEGCFAYCRIS